MEADGHMMLRKSSLAQGSKDGEMVFMDQEAGALRTERHEEGCGERQGLVKSLVSETRGTELDRKESLGT